MRVCVCVCVYCLVKVNESLFCFHKISKRQHTKLHWNFVDAARSKTNHANYGAISVHFFQLVVVLCTLECPFCSDILLYLMIVNNILPWQYHLVGTICCV